MTFPKPAGERVWVKCFRPWSFYATIRTNAEWVFPTVQAFHACVQQKLWYKSVEKVADKRHWNILLPLWSVYKETGPVLPVCILNAISLPSYCSGVDISGGNRTQVFLAAFMEQCEVNLTLQQDHKQHVSLCDDTIVCMSESLLYSILPLCAI